MPTIYPEAHNLTGLFGIVQYVNDVSDKTWAVSVLMLLFLIILIVQLIRQYETSSCFLSASMVTLFIGVAFRLASLITDYTLGVISIIGFISMFWVWSKK